MHVWPGMDALNAADVESLVAKIAALDLSDGERTALDHLVQRGVDDEVTGFAIDPFAGLLSVAGTVSGPFGGIRGIAGGVQPNGGIRGIAGSAAPNGGIRGITGIEWPE
jgi:hypothetical protein